MARRHGLLPVLRSFLSFGFLHGVLTLLAIALLVGTLIWLFEGRQHEAYGGGRCAVSSPALGGRGHDAGRGRRRTARAHCPGASWQWCGWWLRW
jgi:hypothetical protein